MRKQSRLFQASLILLLSAVSGIGQVQSVSAHPYLIKGMDEYRQEQAQNQSQQTSSILPRSGNCV